MANVYIVRRSQANTDWHIGYLDGVPAVADDASAWYEVDEGTALLNRYEGYVWIVRGGKWASIYADLYDGDLANGDDITAFGPDYVEGED